MKFTLLRLTLFITAAYYDLYSSAPSSVQASEIDDEALSTDLYFKLMRMYLGDSVFERQRCLVAQEQLGWVSSNTSTAQMEPFTLGTEGAGHHLIMSLFGNPKRRERTFSTIIGNGGAVSVPSTWRNQHNPDLPLLGAHPDIPDMVARGQLIITMLRYPPSCIMSVLSRFSQCHKGKRNGAKWPWLKPPDISDAPKCQRNITAETELVIMQESFSTVDDLLRFPGFDCGRVLIVPFEIITQHPMALLGPMYQALRLSRPRDLKLLYDRIRQIESHEHEIKQEATNQKARHEVHEMCCAELGLSKVKHKNDLDKLAELHETPCADRVYTKVKHFFDSRRFMFPSIYPSQSLVEVSEELYPGTGLHIDTDNAVQL